MLLLQRHQPKKIEMQETANFFNPQNGVKNRALPGRGGGGGGGGDSGFQVTEMLEGIFGVWKFSIPEFFWVGKFGKYFFWVA